jgi:hypothetical protein
MADHKKPSLTVLGGPLAGTTCELPDSGTITIGSAEGSTLRLDTPGVSPFHARLVVDAGRVTVHETGAERRVHVNDNPLQPSGSPLRNGDILWLGPPGEEDVVMLQCILPQPAVAAEAATVRATLREAEHRPPAEDSTAPTPEIETVALRTTEEPTGPAEPSAAGPAAGPEEAATFEPEEGGVIPELAHDEPMVVPFDVDSETVVVRPSLGDTADAEAETVVVPSRPAAGGEEVAAEAEETFVVDDVEMAEEAASTVFPETQDEIVEPTLPAQADEEETVVSADEIVEPSPAPPGEEEGVGFEVPPEPPAPSPPPPPTPPRPASTPSAASPPSPPTTPADASHPPAQRASEAPRTADRPSASRPPSPRPSVAHPPRRPATPSARRAPAGAAHDGAAAGAGGGSRSVLLAAAGFVGVLVIAGLGWTAWRLLSRPAPSAPLPSGTPTPVAALTPPPTVPQAEPTSVPETPAPAAEVPQDTATPVSAAAVPSPTPAATATPPPQATPTPTPTPRPTPSPVAPAGPSPEVLRAQQVAAQVDGLLGQAQSALASRQYDAAVGRLDEALRLDPGNARATSLRTDAVRRRDLARRRFVSGRTAVLTQKAQQQSGLAGFETGDADLRKAPDFQGRLEFEMTPGTGLDAGTPWTLRIYVVNDGKKSIRVQGVTATTSVNGSGSGGPVAARAREIAPQQRVLLGELSGTWQEGTTSWSTEVVMTANKGDSLKNAVTWR